MIQKPVLIQVPILPISMGAIYDDLLDFGTGNGDGVAKNFELVSRPWNENHLVWLCPQLSETKFDCIHSLYGAVMQEQSLFYELLGVHGLYCLAAHLKQAVHPALKSFTGVVHALNGSMMSEKVGMSHGRQAPWKAYDLLTPVLYIENGQPRSIYTKWHSDIAEESALVAFCGSSNLFEFEEEAAHLAA